MTGSVSSHTCASNGTRGAARRAPARAAAFGVSGSRQSRSTRSRTAGGGHAASVRPGRRPSRTPQNMGYRAAATGGPWSHDHTSHREHRPRLRRLEGRLRQVRPGPRASAASCPTGSPAASTTRAGSSSTSTSTTSPAPRTSASSSRASGARRSRSGQLADHRRRPVMLDVDGGPDAVLTVGRGLGDSQRRGSPVPDASCAGCAAWPAAGLGADRTARSPGAPCSSPAPRPASARPPPGRSPRAGRPCCWSPAAPRSSSGSASRIEAAAAAPRRTPATSPTSRTAGPSTSW